MTRTRLTFRDAQDHDDSPVRDVIAGRKNDRADTVDACYQSCGEYGDGSYAAGDENAVYDLQQRLRCVIKAIKVEHIRFRHIPQGRRRGETFASAEAFRQCHINCLPRLRLHFTLLDVIQP